MPPLVTVVIATYNRSNLLRYTIQSVLWQTLSDFELWVVGDACTDDTAEVVASFNDARIRWHNLPKNSGSQAIPHNYGIQHARGKYIAYLGHDDLWYFNHLEILVGALEAQQAVLAHSLTERIGWNGVRAISGVPTEAYMKPENPFVPPGSVLHTRTLVDSIGLWHDHRTSDETPDREFFGRARSSGQRIIAVPELTYFKFPAIWRPDCYQQDFSAEQAEYVRRMQSERDFVTRELIAIAQAYVLGQTEPPPYTEAYNPKIKHHGWRVERTRRIRGLSPQETPKPTTRHLLTFAANRVRKHIRRVKERLLAT